MRKRIFVYFLIITTCLFHLLVPDVVLGQAEDVFSEYNETFRLRDVHDHFPKILKGLLSPDIFLNSSIISNFVVNPRGIKLYVQGADDSIVVLLTFNRKFMDLFEDPDFHIVVQDATKNRKLQQLINSIPEEDLTGDPFCEIPTTTEPPEPKPTTLRIVLASNNQSGGIGESLARPFVVEVMNQDGGPLKGTEVTFTASGGQLSTPTTRQTDANGQASIDFTLGVNPGIYHIKARVAGQDSLNGVPLTQIFTATAIGVALPKPTTLEIVQGSNNQMGEAGKTLAQPLVVEVKNSAGQLLSGIGVIFSVMDGGGSLLDDTAITGTGGRAEATLTLGALPGENTVQVWVAGSPSRKETFTATAIARSVAQFPLLSTLR